MNAVFTMNSRCFLVFLIFGCCRMASIEAQSFRTLELLRDSTQRALNLNIESISFVKNNEYDSDFADGFTGIGFSLKPTLEYWASQTTKINAGAFLLKYSGRDDFTQAIPIFTVQQKLTNDLDLVLGSIYGNLNHELDEPLYRIDRFYQENVEYGLQLLYQRPKFKSDVWLAWNQFILMGDDFQEQWVAGTNSKFIPFKKDKFTLSIPFQFTLFHYGGEIDTSPDPVLSIINARIGLSLKYQINENSSFYFDPSLYLYNGVNVPDSGIHSEPFDHGSAIYLKSNFEYKNINLGLAYWQADQFIAPSGEYLLLSRSGKGNGVFQATRSFLNATFNIQKEITPSIVVEFNARGYYDLEDQKFSHALGLYIFINEIFSLGKFKKDTK